MGSQRVGHSLATGERQQHTCALQADSLLSEPPGKALCVCVYIHKITIYIVTIMCVQTSGSRNWGRNIGKSKECIPNTYRQGFNFV